MEFTIDAFVNRIRKEMSNLFPFENEAINKQKHKNRQEHIRDVAFMNNPVRFEDNLTYFDIGNYFSEANYPYYHILEDSRLIHTKNNSTKSSRGSQAEVKNLGDRNYGKIRWNGKTFSQEYRKNVRGMRGMVKKGGFYVDSQGVVHQPQQRANVYENVHYHYIERILNAILPSIASEFNLKQARTQSSGLKDEYSLQEYGIMSIIDTLTED